MSVTVEPELLRARLARSPLARRGGWLVTTLLDPVSLSTLRAEAASCHAAAEPYFVREHDGQENRGGAPDRWLESSIGGPALTALSRSSWVASFLTAATLLTWRPSGGGGTYSYYCREGHHLGIHRDIEECDLAVLVCVEDAGFDPSSHAGTLCTYPSRGAQPLSAIRAEPERGARYVRTRPGEAAILLGGIVPHRVVPLGRGHTRIVAPLCFSASGTAR
jgi:hypothetical protein